MAEGLPRYEVYAIRYASRAATRAENFIGADPHDDAPMPLDYYVWAIRGARETFLLDLGFTAETAAARKRDFLRCPIEALRLIDVDPAAVANVIVSHMHYDHVGNFHKLANAVFHLQEAEMHYAVGRHMRHPFLNHPFNVEDVVGLVRLNYASRVRFHQGDAEIAPGLSVHRAGGHSAGLQFARVHTSRGWVVLASDATHFYANLDEGRPFPTIVSTAEQFDTFERLAAAAPSRDHIVPGHDPLVMQYYPPASNALAGIVARLDAAPSI
jgi:glyoxylase-like metal-dependent hydrolase (beta-lactamase superfamily II)